MNGLATLLKLIESAQMSRLPVSSLRLLSIGILKRPFDEISLHDLREGSEHLRDLHAFLSQLPRDPEQLDSLQRDLDVFLERAMTYLWNFPPDEG